MGSWQLEVGKMFVYVLFPVAMFHIYNKPELFENMVNETREKYMPESSRQEFAKLLEELKENKRVNVAKH